MSFTAAQEQQLRDQFNSDLESVVARARASFEGELERRRQGNFLNWQILLKPD